MHRLAQEVWRKTRISPHDPQSNFERKSHQIYSPYVPKHIHGHTHHIRAKVAHVWYIDIDIHMYVFRREPFRLKHSVSRVATAIEDDSAAEPFRKQSANEWLELNEAECYSASLQDVQGSATRSM